MSAQYTIDSEELDLCGLARGDQIMQSAVVPANEERTDFMPTHIGHLALRVPDPRATASFLQRVLGLRETDGAEAGEVLLTANEKHHELQLLAGESASFDHIGLEVEGYGELEALLERVQAHGARILTQPATDDALGNVVTFADPSGVVYEAYDGMHREPMTLDKHLRPQIRRFGHITMLSDRHEDICEFWLQGLGFHLSDKLDDLTWTRGDSEHHGLAVGGREVEGTVLHHYAWEVQDLSALGAYCDHIAREGLTLEWGPVRHGPGFNLATYVSDPNGAIIETYTDLIQIPDPKAYTPIDWSNEPRALNLWGPGPADPPAFGSAGLPLRSLDAVTTVAS